MNTLNPQWFLNEGTDLTYIPSSKSLLRIHGKQKKCCQIYHSVFDPDVIAKIDNGEHMPLSQMSVNVCCYVMTFLLSSALESTDLEGTSSDTALESTDLEGTSNNEAALDSTDLEGTSNNEAALESTDLEGTSNDTALDSTDLEGTSNDAALESTDLEGTSNNEAALESTDLEGTSNDTALESTDLEGTSNDAALESTDLEGTSNDTALESTDRRPPRLPLGKYLCMCKCHAVDVPYTQKLHRMVSINFVFKKYMKKISLIRTDCSVYI